MPETILVVEYEPRYNDRVRQALIGQPLVPSFAKDGEEALRALSVSTPRLIILSSVLPKISTSDLIRTIRALPGHSTTPILVTVSGYTGRNTRGDALRFGASDLLPKPYSDAEFMQKLRDLLGLPAPQTGPFESTTESELTVQYPKVQLPKPAQGGMPTAQMTSSEIFGEILADHPRAAEKKPKKPADDLDKILADTLSGVRPGKKKTLETEKPPVAAPVHRLSASEARARSSAQVDRILHDSLSGLEKGKHKVQHDPAPGSPAPSRAPAVPAPTLSASPSPSASPLPSRSPLAADSPARPPAFAPAPLQTVPPAAPLSREAETEEDDGIQFGQYVLLERIATGGMAEVWKARMRGVEGFQKTVAIKKILPHLSDDDEFIEMFVDEAKLAAQLNHSNIIHIYDLGKIASSFYIAMEYIDGHDLKTILKQGEDRSQPMAMELALFITSKVASALDYAHRKRDFDEKEMGLVHRDVSPQNILISHEGDIKLCDFGIAKAASKASHTQAGALKGKLQYMSPEQAWGRKIDRRSDIFALAIVMFELLTARKLFSGENEISVLEKVREAKVVPPSSINEEVTPAIDTVVLKALNKDPDARYQTAGELARDLDSILYSLRPTPTSADLAIYMHRIYSEEEVPAESMLMEQPAADLHSAQSPTILSPIQELALPRVTSYARRTATPIETSAAAPPAGHAHEVNFVPPATSRKLPIVPVAIAVVLVLGIGGFFALRSKSAPAGANSQVNAGAPAGPAVTPPVAANQQSALSEIPTGTAGTPTAPAGSSTTTSAEALTDSIATVNPQMDQDRIDQEVGRRLTAERTRLDTQRAQQAAAERAREEQLSREEPVRQQRLDQQAAQPVVPPVTQTTAPSAASATQPLERPPDPAPVPVQTQAQERPVRQGDLVEVGTEGLVPPELVRMKLPLYPPLAKAQRVEGLVVLSVLIGEDGKVLEVRLLRGVKQKVGINEAAIQAVRNSIFRPATKDGILVKAYKTVTIPFKL